MTQVTTLCTHGSVTVQCCVIQKEFTGLCHFLINDCKEDLYHWKQSLLQDGVITSSELCGISDNQFFIKYLPAMGCKSSLF